MLTKSEEDYLKVIFLLEVDLGKPINTNFIAERVRAKASSVTDMLKKLSLKKFVLYKKYKGVCLSGKGRIIASSIVRKHRLWETFLVSKLDFSWDKVHDIAEQLEHIQSDELIDSLDKFLNFPKLDPHGEPIPDKNGNITALTSILLSNAKVKKRYSISGIKDTASSFLQYMDSINLKINTVFTVSKVIDFDNSILIFTNNSYINLSNKICNNLFRKPL